MSKQVISEIANRQAFMTLLQHNPGLIVLKLGAEWCGPCKTIKAAVNGFFASAPPEIQPSIPGRANIKCPTAIIIPPYHTDFFKPNKRSASHPPGKANK